MTHALHHSQIDPLVPGDRLDQHLHHHPAGAAEHADRIQPLHRGGSRSGPGDGAGELPSNPRLVGWGGDSHTSRRGRRCPPSLHDRGRGRARALRWRRVPGRRADPEPRTEIRHPDPCGWKGSGHPGHGTHALPRQPARGGVHPAHQQPVDLQRVERGHGRAPAGHPALAHHLPTDPRTDAAPRTPFRQATSTSSSRCARRTRSAN